TGENEVGFADCKEYEANNKWHLVDVEVQYKWNGVELWDRAFKLVTRDSVRKWSQQVPTADKPADPSFKCVDYAEIQTPKIEGVVQTSQPKNSIFEKYKLRLSDCSATRLMFVTVPNDVSGDANLYGKVRWTRVVGIDIGSPKFAHLDKAHRKYKPYLAKACKEGCLSNTCVESQEGSCNSEDQIPMQEKRIDLGDFTWTDGSFVLNRVKYNPETFAKAETPVLLSSPTYSKSRINMEDSKKSGYEDKFLLGGCAHHLFNGESECFVEGTSEPLSTYKKLYHATLDNTRGYVVQIRSSGRCVLWNGQKVDCNGKNIDKGSGPDASQYRLSFVAPPVGRTEAYAQLQRVWPDPAQKTLMCYDISLGREVPCCDEQKGCDADNNHTYMFADYSLLNKNEGNKPYNLQFCAVSSSTKENIAYDCVDYVDPKWKRYSLISSIIGVIPILGSIPSYVLDGMVCKSGEVTIARGSCIGLIVGISIDVLMLPLDFIGFMGTGSEIAHQLLERGAVKVNAGLVLDMVTDPVSASLAWWAAKRAVGQISAKQVGKEGLEAAVKEMSEPLTRMILTRALKMGVSGSSAALSYSKSTLENMIKAASNVARGGI
ncbi:MAG: hypothetical protein HQK54_05230, partial [Oligoflexales bacterium]|nr:hypothetical protein [Oligoflexales bacterium]